MPHEWEQLASRVKQVIDADKRKQERLEAEERERRDSARKARAELFNELSAFAHAVGHFDIEQSDERLTISYADHHLEIRAVGAADEVSIQWANSEEHAPELVRETFGGSWLFGRREGDELRWVPLFNVGLQSLCHYALGLPMPPGGSAHKAVLFTRDTQANETITYLDDGVEPTEEV